MPSRPSDLTLQFGADREVETAYFNSIVEAEVDFKDGEGPTMASKALSCNLPRSALSKKSQELAQQLIQSIVTDDQKEKSRVLKLRQDEASKAAAVAEEAAKEADRVVAEARRLAGTQK